MKTKTLILFIATLMTTANAFACEEAINQAKQMLSTDGTVQDEMIFLSKATTALNLCKETADKQKTVTAFILLGQQSCDDASNQGQSTLFKSYCYLKVAQSASFILGK